MPDSRKSRGPHPTDQQLFAVDELEGLRLAVSQLAWLLSRGYAERSALKLVGDRHGLRKRQREAVRRACCSDQQLRSRRRREVGLDAATGGLLIDGFNLLITIECALSGGLVLVGRDRCHRDLASVQGTYRKVRQTADAIRLVARTTQARGAGPLRWLLDRPVSNSGKLRKLLGEVLAEQGAPHNVELVDDPDGVLGGSDAVVVSSDSAVLDRAARWTNLGAAVIAASVPDAWLVDLAPE